jgi:ribosome-associated heat shock protein Hsp15
MSGRRGGDRDEHGAAGTPTSPGTQRLDKWLWFVRVVRSRTSAAELVVGGRVRVNRERVLKPAHTVRPGDVVTVTVESRVRILEMVAPGERRGSATEAQALYRDLTPPREPRESDPVQLQATREAGSGRPTKRDRRAIDRLRHDDC